MSDEKTVNNGSVKISFPGRWMVMVFVGLFGTMGLTFQSARTQADVVERGILIHAQEKHLAAASAEDLRRVEYVQESMGNDVAELRELFKEFSDLIQELVIEVRAQK